MIRLIRLAILIVLTFVAVSFVIAIGRPETGLVEKIVLGAVVAGTFGVAARLRRLGAPPAEDRRP